MNEGSRVLWIFLVILLLDFFWFSLVLSCSGCIQWTTYFEDFLSLFSNSFHFLIVFSEFFLPYVPLKYIYNLRVMVSS